MSQERNIMNLKRFVHTKPKPTRHSCFARKISINSYAPALRLSRYGICHYRKKLDQYTNQPGWIAENPAHINGAYGLTGYYYQQYGQPAYLQSPYMDLSAAGGKVSVSADLYGAYVTDLDICNAIIRMLTIDLEKQRSNCR